MHTAMEVYQAPQMKNWRNIIVDSLVRITASGSRDGEFFGQAGDGNRPLRQDNVPIFGGRCDPGTHRATDDAAHDRALLVAAEHTIPHRTGSRSRPHLRRVTCGDAAALVSRLDRVDSRLDGVRM